MANDIAIAEQALPTMVSAQDFALRMEEATAKAKILTNVIAAQSDKYVVRAQGQEFLRYEAWATLGQGYGYTAGVESYENIYDTDGHTILGVEAYAMLRDNMGTQVGGAPARCMFDEPSWSNKPLPQLASMAGTRAASKAFRIGLSWVVVLAGYNPTPAEEFERDASGEVVVASRTASPKPPRKRAESPNKAVKTPQPTSDMEEIIICPLHGYDSEGNILLVPDRNGTPRQVTFFKSEKMKNHAHPIDGTDPTEWCNRYEVVKLIETGELEVTPIPVPDPTPVPEPEPEPVPAVDAATQMQAEAEAIKMAAEVLMVESDEAEEPFRDLAESSGYTWEEVVEQVLPTDSLTDYLSMGGSLKGLTARLKRIQENKNG